MTLPQLNPSWILCPGQESDIGQPWTQPEPHELRDDTEVLNKQDLKSQYYTIIPYLNPIPILKTQSIFLFHHMNNSRLSVYTISILNLIITITITMMIIIIIIIILKDLGGLIKFNTTIMPSFKLYHKIMSYFTDQHMTT